MSAERGSATVHAVCIATALLVVALVVAQVAALVRLRHQVASAADLAALAGSRAAAAGTDGCRAARRVATANEVRLAACRMDLEVATVTAQASTSPWWGGEWTARVPARAAPEEYVVPDGR